MALQVIVLIALLLSYFNHFPFAYSIIVVIYMMNMIYLIIRLIIIESPIMPKHEVGITIWWLCCVSIGRKGKYSFENMKKKYEK